MTDDADGGVGAGGAAEELLAGLEALVSGDLSGLTAAELSDLVLVFERAQGRIDAARLRVLGEWDRREAWGFDGALSGASWLAARTGMAHSTARERLRVARKATQMVLVVAALASARLCWAKVRLFAQFLTDGTAEAFARDEQMLVNLTAPLSVEGTRQVLERWAAQVDPDGFDRDDEQRQEARKVFASQTYDGMTVLNGMLTPEAGLLFMGALARIANELYQDETRQGDAAASPRTPAQRRHDALMEMAERALAWNANTSRRAVPLLNAAITVEGDALAQDARGIGTRNGPPVPAQTIQRLACSAAMARVLFDPQGNVLDWGRRRRLFTATQAEILFLKYGGCGFPGCDRPPAWCQIHHILEWDKDHGPTDLANGIPLCRKHHTCVHEGGYTITTTTDGTPTFHRPNGTPITLHDWQLAA